MKGPPRALAIWKRPDQSQSWPHPALNATRVVLAPQLLGKRRGCHSRGTQACRHRKDHQLSHAVGITMGNTAVAQVPGLAQEVLDNLNTACGTKKAATDALARYSRIWTTTDRDGSDWNAHKIYMLQSLPFPKNLSNVPGGGRTTNADEVGDWLDTTPEALSPLRAAMKKAGAHIAKHNKFNPQHCNAIVEAAKKHVPNAVMLVDSPNDTCKQFVPRVNTILAELTPKRYEALDEPAFASHWAHPAQLMFGKFIGDTLKLPAAMAALLSPTGGIVGAGDKKYNKALFVLVDIVYSDPVIDRHSVVHDAFGFLYTLRARKGQPMGPGYTYIDPNPYMSGSNALADQLDGLRWWKAKMEMHKKGTPLKPPL